jgi:hypothetical protein
MPDFNTNMLERSDLLSLEQYAEQRDEFRARVMAHKKYRRIAIGPHLALYFEDRLTIQYQVQEMLRIEKIFEADAIQEELDTYNPLVPNGSNWKATAMLEYQDVEERRSQLARLKGIEHLVWVQVAGFGPVPAISNEDLERSTDEKTSAVHFMRFELDREMIEALQAGEELVMGVDHGHYHYQAPVTEPQLSALLADLTEP